MVLSHEPKKRIASLTCPDAGTWLMDLHAPDNAFGITDANPTFDNNHPRHPSANRSRPLCNASECPAPYAELMGRNDVVGGFCLCLGSGNLCE